MDQLVQLSHHPNKSIHIDISFMVIVKFIRLNRQMSQVGELEHKLIMGCHRTLQAVEAKGIQRIFKLPLPIQVNGDYIWTLSPEQFSSLRQESALETG